MTARSAIELTAFERIHAGVGTVLLRVTATTREALPAGVRPSLLVVGGDDTDRVSALPAPPDPTGLLRAAYPVPASLVGAATEFVLLFDDGTRVALPAPAERPGPSRTLPDEAESQHRAIEDLERRLQAERSYRDSLEADAAERGAELRRVWAEFAEHAEHATTITAALQANADVALAEAAQHRADAERVRAHLEQAQAAAAGAERRAADRAEEIERLQGELQRMSERVDRLDAALDAAQADMRDARQTCDRLREQLIQQTEDATTAAANFEALVEIANAEAAQHLERVQQLESELTRPTARLDQQRDGEPAVPPADAQIAAIEAELGEARAISGSLAAELDEAQIRADTLAGVVRAETNRREDTERELQLAQHELETLRHELERAHLEAEAQSRASARGAPAFDPDPPVDRRDNDAAEGDPAPDAANSGTAREAPSAETRTSALAPPGAPAHVTGPSGPSPHRVRGAVQTLPAEVTAGLLLFVLGIILAILALTGQFG